MKYPKMRMHQREEHGVVQNSAGTNTHTPKLGGTGSDSAFRKSTKVWLSQRTTSRLPQYHAAPLAAKNRVMHALALGTRQQRSVIGWTRHLAHTAAWPTSYTPSTTYLSTTSSDATFIRSSWPSGPEACSAASPLRGCAAEKDT